MFCKRTHLKIDGYIVLHEEQDATAMFQIQLEFSVQLPLVWMGFNVFIMILIWVHVLELSLSPQERRYFKTIRFHASSL